MVTDQHGGSLPDDTLPRGTHIGQYEILKLIGRGGMASVYKATQTTLDRPVALKVMAPLLSTQPSFRQRFLKEAQTVARLNHPNIVTVHDFGEASMRHFLALEYVGGGDLKAKISSGPLPPEKALGVLAEMAQALSYAHQKGFVHRDVKPENILFHESGQAMLSDFGIALAVESSTRMTGTGMSIGTPHYMSPEQCQGEQDLDGRSDLYSLGIVFYEMLTGKVPFDAANTVGIVMKHVQAPVPKLPPPLAKYQSLLNGLLAKDRNKRYPDAAALLEAIDALQSGKPPAVPKHKYARSGKTEVIATPAQRKPASQKVPSPASSASQQPSSHGIVWALGGAALAAGIAIGVLYFYQAKPVTVGGGAAVPVVQNQPRTPMAAGNNTNRSKRTPSALEQQLSQPAAGISIIPNPTTSRIFINGAYAGTGSLKITDLAAGRAVTIRAEAQGYEPLEQVVRVPSDRLLQLAMNLQKVIPKYAFTIEPDPADATIRILNIGPRYQRGMLLEPGRYQVEVSKAGYVTETRWVEVTDGGLSRSIPLRRASFALTISPVPVDATIRLLKPDRVYRPGMALSPGRYRYEVTKPGYRAQQGTVVLSDRDVMERVTLVASYAAGQVFKDCADCPEMVVIPAGSFLMGSSSNEKGRYSDEGPQHRVTISQPFALGKYEVTFEEYDAFARATSKSLPKDRGWGRGRRPVIYVSWEEARAYAKWLSQRTGKRYRLPTEAEWEYAARAGTGSAYWWGNSIGRNRANCDGCGSRWDNKQTAPVGSFAANAFGLSDVHGNVWEWVEDCWNGSYSGAPANGSAWLRGDCSRRVMRGGSWNNYPRDLRVAGRLRLTPSYRNVLYGFRLARTL